VNLAGFLTGLEAYRGKLDAVIDATRDLLSLSSNGSAPAAELVAPPTPVAGNGARSDKRGEALEMWKAGKSVAEIAAMAGKTEAAIYYWKKTDNWPERGKRVEEAVSAERMRFRCQECKQFGVDPKRCEHCMEKR